MSTTNVVNGLSPEGAMETARRLLEEFSQKTSSTNRIEVRFREAVAQCDCGDSLDGLMAELVYFEGGDEEGQWLDEIRGDYGCNWGESAYWMDFMVDLNDAILRQVYKLDLDEIEVEYIHVLTEQD